MSDDDWKKAVEDGGVDPAAIDNACGDKWDFGCSEAWACYDLVEENGCCDSGSGNIFTDGGDCSACAQVVGVCDDCFPFSKCGDNDLAAAATDDSTAADTTGAETPAVDDDGKENTDKCLIADPSFTCIGSQCPDPQSDYPWYAAYDGAWCNNDANSDLCLAADKSWCGGECNCPTNCQHACGRCPPPAKAGSALPQVSSNHSSFLQLQDEKPRHHKKRHSQEYSDTHRSHIAIHHKKKHSQQHPRTVVHYKRRHSEEVMALHREEDMALKPKKSKLKRREEIRNQEVRNQQKSWGDAKCPCVGFANVEGKRMVRLDENTTTAYPADFGSSCHAWDDGRNFLGCMEGQSPGQGKGWCAQKWCYVDPCQCDIATLPKTSPYLPGSTFQDRPIYYSYATCGGTDTYTATRKEACVNLESEEDCIDLKTEAGLTKCAWHEGKCMGKELVGVCEKKLDDVKYGTGKCRCVGIDSLLGNVVVNTGDWKAGSFLDYGPGGDQSPSSSSFMDHGPGGHFAAAAKSFPNKVTRYPADTGATCQAWDNGRHPDCDSKNVTERPEWCEQKWCYVDPCSCDIDISPKRSFYIPGALFQGIPIYYSYSTCGSVDTWTAKHHKTACVNQNSKEDCGKLDKCSWTGTKCLGKELMGHCPAIGEREKAKPVDVKHEKPKKSSAYATTFSSITLLLLALLRQ
jgi:hypothetical protein